MKALTPAKHERDVQLVLKPVRLSPALIPRRWDQGSCSRSTGARFLQPPEYSQASLVPSPSQGEALHGANGQLFHIPRLKTSPVFVIIVYVLGCKQQGTLSSALDVLSPSWLLQTDGPRVQVMSQLHLANKSNNQNHHFIHKE